MQQEDQTGNESLTNNVSNSISEGEKDQPHGVSTASGGKANGSATGDTKEDNTTDSRKPISQRKILANRENARHSTGPRTAAGKLFSRRNAVHHGALANPIVVGLAEDAEEFNRLYAELRRDLKPQRIVEGQLVLMAATSLWRIERATKSERATIEKNLYEEIYRQVFDSDNTLAFGSIRRRVRENTEKLLTFFERVEAEIQEKKALSPESISYAATTFPRSIQMLGALRKLAQDGVESPTKAEDKSEALAFIRQLRETAKIGLANIAEDEEGEKDANLKMQLVPQTSSSQNLTRYMTTAQNQYVWAITELRRVQKERRGR